MSQYEICYNENSRIKFNMVSSVRNIFLPKEGQLHYIGGTEILPPPLSPEEEWEVLEQLKK